jgi:hypothetical protein
MRFNLLPDPKFFTQVSALEDRIFAAANLVNPDTFLDFADKVAIAALEQAFRTAGAEEGTIWLADRTEEVLTPVYNNGPRAEEWVGKFRQPMSAGLISTVFAAEQPFCENEVWRNAAQDRALDQRLAVRTEAMIAVPFYFARECRGVISCVKLAHPEGARRFSKDSPWNPCGKSAWLLPYSRPCSTIDFSQEFWVGNDFRSGVG